MEITFLKLLFIAAVSEELELGKHVYVQYQVLWPDAQEYCREHYTDLSPITTPSDEERLKHQTKGTVHGLFWTGLYREPENPTGWKWSGGGYASDIPWAAIQPSNLNGEYYVSVCWIRCPWFGWHDVEAMNLSFFCLNLVVVEEKKSWEEALQYCREDHTELTSLVSETELLLAQREIEEAQTTERVWIGLRYLGDRWLWVNGEPLEYQAWPQGDQDHRCPNWSHSCGGLTKEGLWENWDCQEKLNFICY